MTTATETAVHRGSCLPWDRPVRLTPLYHEHLTHGADMVERDGWLLPRSYGDLNRERATLHNAVGLLDWSDTAKISLKGDHIEEMLLSAFPETTSAEVNQTGAAPNRIGRRVYRLSEQEVLIITAPDEARQTLEVLTTTVAQRHSMHLVDLTSALCCLRLVGPNSPGVLQRVSALDLAPDRFSDGTVVQGAVAKVRALVVRRDDGEFIGYDLYVDRDLGVYLWDTLLEIGTPLGILPVGRDAEAGLS